ncbi:hypothetical protein, conserved [Leishmania tarentolae]|uniref:Uncharacterized protein n=1 Tax=Leishmania tarentolae TaxID=5689 RepID=A0A640KKG6_LEITA|nr:hypothetical protein, conserved [Leishmania tarentolae]
MSVTDPYSLSPQSGAAEATLFQLLLPAHATPADRGAVGEVMAVKTESDYSPEKITGPPAVSSPSVSERIYAWDTVSHTRTAHSFCDTGHTEFDGREDPTFLHTVDAQQPHDAFAEKGSHVWHPGAVGQDCSTRADADPHTVPLSMRWRELERRFEEQMTVHRGLTAASRQLDVLRHSVQMFQAERRTRKFVQALAERQGAIWARVWPGGYPPKMDDTAATAQRQRAPSAGVAPAPAARLSGSSAATLTNRAISPAPPASPTGSLLKDILDTYSKPPELREGSSGGGRSAAATPSPPKGTKAQKGAPLAPAREVWRTTSGLEIVRPEEAPKPYAVIRYVEARPKHASTISDTVTPATVAGVSSAYSKNIARSDVKENSSPVLSSVVSEVDQADEVGGEKLSDLSSSSVPDEASSMNSTYDVETFGSRASSSTAAVASMSSAKRSAVSSLTSTVEATSSFRTQSVTSEEVESSTDRRPSKSKRRDGGQKSASSVSNGKHAAAFSEILQAFFDACRCVSAASARLLETPYIQESSHGAAQHRQHTSPAAKKCASRLVSKVAEDAGETGEVKDAASSVTAYAAAGADVAPATWSEALHRQLRNVRRLQRFRKHLLRHLKLIDVQRQTHYKSTRLLQETQALAKVRCKLVFSSRVGDNASLGNMLRHIKGFSTGTAKGKPPRRGSDRPRHRTSRQPHSPPSWPRASKVNDADTVSEVVSTVMNSSISDDITSADSSVVEEMLYGSDRSDAAISDSVVEEDVGSWDEASGHSEVDSGGTVLTEVSRNHGSNRGSSYDSDSFEATNDSDSVGRPGWISRSGLMPGVGLDEIEEELADRLAAMSTDAISEGSSIPSDVEELVDLLPSSLIPSDVENGDARSRGSSSITMDSDIATDMSNSAADLQERQRRMYVGTKGSAARYAAGGDSGVLADHKAYICDSPDSSVYSVPEDADVDTSMRQSADVHSEDPQDSVPRTSESVAILDGAATVGAADEYHIRGRSSPTLSTRSDEISSGFEDALTKLEVDMALTKERRHHALRSASAVPTFEQLYDPSMPSLGERLLRDSCNASTTSSAVSSRSSKPDRRKGGSERSVDMKELDTTVAPLEKQGEAHSVHYSTARMEVGTQAEMPAVERQSTAISGASRMRAIYPAEDYVAQSVWKARQLHLFRQLRSPIMDYSEGVTKNSAEGTENRRRGFEPCHRRQKDKADAGFDAAEAAAREEWAQHWAVVESLLHTRFSASSCIGSGEPPSSSRHAAKALLGRFPSDSAPPTRDASQSSVRISSASH